jgi:heme-degrading monooxygenase HmoA
MVTEIARFRAQPGKADDLANGLIQGAEVIKTAEGCRSIKVSRCIEDDQLFIFQIEWETLAHHVDMFRSSPLFAQYRSHITGLFVEPVDVNHFEAIRE